MDKENLMQETSKGRTREYFFKFMAEKRLDAPDLVIKFISIYFITICTCWTFLYIKVSICSVARKTSDFQWFLC